MNREYVQRITVSLPQDVYEELNSIVDQSGFVNRSQLVSEMLRQEILVRKQENDAHVMAGTITYFYDEGFPHLHSRLVAIQRKYVSEVISSLSVLLENEYRMEVLVVQGPVRTLKAVLNEITGCRGVETVRLSLSRTVLPPIHAPQNKSNQQNTEQETVPEGATSYQRTGGTKP